MILSNLAQPEVFVIVFLATLALLKVFQYFIIARVKHLAEKTKTEIDDMVVEVLESFKWPFYVGLALFTASLFIDLSTNLRNALNATTVLLVAYYLVRGVERLVDYLIINALKRSQKGKKLDKFIENLIRRASKVVLWGLIAIIVLQNFGVNVTALIGGLGVGGIAIAFALQNVLGDLFAYFTINLDKPFQEGDYIVIGEDSGTVTSIGLKSSRLKTLKGEELIMSNKELTESRLHNFKKMEKRRIAFMFGVTYETPTSKLKKIPGVVKKIFKDLKDVELDRVHFKEMADSSLNYEVVFYVKKPDYLAYVDNQQAINLKILEEFEKLKIDMAYPTQTLYVSKNS